MAIDLELVSLGSSGHSPPAEDGLSPVLLLFVGVGACGMFAFLVMGGSFLGIVRTTMPSTGRRRRLIDAVTLMCASVPVALAFRDSLWWAIGSTNGQPGLGPLATLFLRSPARFSSLSLPSRRDCESTHHADDERAWGVAAIHGLEATRWDGVTEHGALFASLCRGLGARAPVK